MFQPNVLDNLPACKRCGGRRSGASGRRKVEGPSEPPGCRPFVVAHPSHQNQSIHTKTNINFDFTVLTLNTWLSPSLLLLTRDTRTLKYQLELEHTWGFWVVAARCVKRVLLVCMYVHTWNAARLQRRLPHTSALGRGWPRMPQYKYVYTYTYGAVRRR